MRVLMFGWEFPPHISGGLGTACYGMVRGLANNECSPMDFLERINFLRIGSNLVPYVDPRDFSEMVEEDRHNQVNDFKINFKQKYKFSGKYGTNLMGGGGPLRSRGRHHRPAE